MALRAAARGVAFSHMHEIEAVQVVRLSAAGPRQERDHVAVEAPLEIRVDGAPVTITLRTPGDDEALARGLLFAEGLIAGGGRAGPRVLAVHPQGEQGIELHLDAPLAAGGARRAFLATSSCGACGKDSLEALRVDLPPVPPGFSVARAVVASLPDRLRSAQRAFEATGGLHAAGAFDAAGQMLVVREDVGRHNAVDKVVGWAHQAGRLPFSDAILCVSGRTSYEIVQKAVCAGFPVVAAVSAPSSLAIAFAEAYGVALCGFVRAGAVTVYAHAERIG